MSPFLYALNIGTLATWISVAGFGAVGIVVPMAGEMLKSEESVTDPYRDLESTVLLEDFTPETLDSLAAAAVELENETPPAEPEVMPEPPEMPELSEIEPLPEIPNLVPRKDPVFTTPTPAPAKPKVQSAPAPTRTSAAPAKPRGPVVGSSAGSGLSDSKRLSSGRMPPPSYPAEARAKGQTGTVVIEFVVNEAGKVVSTSLKSPSPWPLLNERASSTVRRWTFPPGRVTKYVRPITFKLN